MLAFFFQAKEGIRVDLLTGVQTCALPIEAPAGEYLTDRLTAEAEGFLQRSKDKPFFLYLAHYAVHIPMRARADLVKKYPHKLVPGRQSNAIYAAMLESLDESVGRVVSTLDRLKLSERTLIVFTS